MRLRSKQIHDVAYGDTLQSLSLHYYGNDAFWERIWFANQQILKYPDNIQAGMQLVIP